MNTFQWMSLGTLVMSLTGCGKGSSNGQEGDPDPECESNSDCTGSGVCRDGVCFAADDCEGENCDSCDDDQACTDSEHCADGLCMPDVCEEGASRCNDKGEIAVCSSRGDSESVVACPEGDSCEGAEGEAKCGSWVCSPGQRICEENVVGECSQDGLSIESLDDCGESDAICVEGECEPKVCEPSSLFCKEGDVYVCDDLGLSESVSVACDDDTFCDSTTLDCELQVCEPGEPGCSSGMAGVCDDLGSGYIDLKVCELDQTCVAGSCEPIICDPFSSFCFGNELRTCSGSGTSATTAATCAADEYCFESGSSASCQTDTCVANTFVCSGNEVRRCNADGTGLLPGSTDCATWGNVCYGGECLLPTCTPGQKLCVDGDVHQCVHLGTATELSTVCQSDEYCEVDTATCQPKICEPLMPSCHPEGWALIYCNELGSDWQPGSRPCSGFKQCWEGECLPIICAASSGPICVDGDHHVCGKNRTGTDLFEGCNDSEHCVDGVGCVPDLCVPTTPMCADNYLTVCSDDGSGPAPSGIDCESSGESCFEAECLTTVCAPDSFTCNGDELVACIENGTAVELRDTCEASEACNAELGRCQKPACLPGETICDGFHRVLECDPTGTGFEDLGQPCSADEVCQGGACVPSSSACSIAGKSWQTPLYVSTGYEKGMAFDGRDTIFLAWAGWANGVASIQVSRYSLSQATLSPPIVLDNFNQISGPLVMAASAEGSAMLFAQARGDTTGLFAYRYDGGVETWGPGELLREGAIVANDKFRVVADAHGRFIGVWEGGDKVRYGYSVPGKPWVVQPELSRSFVEAVEAVIDNRGHAAVGWAAGSATSFSSFNFDTKAWSPVYDVFSTTFDGGYDIDLVFLNQGATQWGVMATTGSTMNPYQGAYRTWQQGNQTTLAGPSLGGVNSEGDLLLAPDGTLVALLDNPSAYGGSMRRLLPGSNTWEINGYAGSFDAQIYPSGDTLAVGESRSTITPSYIEGVGIVDIYFNGDQGYLTKLNNCGAALFYRNASSNYLSFLE